VIRGGRKRTAEKETQKKDTQKKEKISKGKGKDKGKKSLKTNA